MAMTSKTWAPIATFVAVVAIGATAALLHTGSGSALGSPKPLGLANASGATAPGNGDYTLTATLPADTPPDAAVWHFRPASQDEVQRLATALKAGTAHRDGSTWRAGALVVTSSGQWSWYSCGGLDTAVSSDGTTSSCAVSAPGAVSGGGSSSSGGATAPMPGVSPAIAKDDPLPVATPSEPAPMSKQAVVDAVRAVFTAVGLDVADADITNGPYGGSAALTPQVGGLDASGLQTSASVDRASRLTSANGWLGNPVEGDAYPLMSAKDAYEHLPSLVHPDICQLPKDGSSGCVQPVPTQITGAHLGLSVQPTADGGSLLVPSWLFEVKDGEPIPAVAVQTAYQASADPTDPPATANPGTVAVPPAGPREGVPFSAAHTTKDGNVVAVVYESGGCGHANLTSAAKETATTVTISLEADSLAPDTACTADSRPATANVRLQEPLGDRTIIDASTGKPVPLT